jgi:hypothetical protein
MLVLLLLAVAGIWRITTERAPPIVIRRMLATHVRLPGSTPLLAWPLEGEAAVEVEGVGSLGISGGSTPVPIASVAKVMTAYLTLLEHPLAAGEEGFVMTITPADVAEERQRVALDESTLRVSAGEQISERQALQAMLLALGEQYRGAARRSRARRARRVRGPHERHRTEARHALDHLHRPKRLRSRNGLNRRRPVEARARGHA